MFLERVLLFLKKLRITLETNILFFNIMKLYLLFSFLNFECKNRKIHLGYSYIILKTNVTGYSKIFSDNYPHNPNEIWINNNSLSNKTINEYYFNNSNDIIKLVW